MLVLASTYPRWQGDHEPGFVHELCRRLVQRFDVIVLTSHARGAAAEETMDGVRVVRYRYAPAFLETMVYGGGIASNLQRSPWKYLLVPGFLLAQYLRTRALVRSQRVDLIHAHWLIPQGIIAARIAGKNRIPFVVTSHGGDLFGLRSPALNFWKQKVAAASSAMSVVSSAMVTECQRLGLQPRKLSVLPMGVDLTTRFVPDSAVTRHQDELLFVGRLVPKKGLRYLLDAMPRIIDQRPGVVLKIAGFGPDDAALRKQAKALNIEEHVMFLGALPQDRLPDLYRRASVLIAPFVRDDSGNQEGLPVALMEAIGCGCPVVVGNVAGIEDLLGRYAEQLTVDSRNVDALAMAILHALSDVPAAAVRALAIRADAEERIGWDHIAKAYGDLLAQELQG
nr:glycosyltransferase [Dyella sp. ASV21]